MKSSFLLSLTIFEFILKTQWADVSLEKLNGLIDWYGVKAKLGYVIIFRIVGAAEWDPILKKI